LSSSERVRPVPTAVVGASAGGVEALRQLVSALPPDYAGALLVVLHVAPAGRSVLPQILTRAGALPATHAVDGETVEPGHIYVAPPDRHLLVADGHLTLDRGPRVNGYRPAVDLLFRTAAETFGRGAVGVVLSGVLDDGTAGLLAIKRRGGRAFVQDPREAHYPGMPTSAMAFVKPDLVAGADALGHALAELAAQPRESAKEVHLVPEDTFGEVDRGAGDQPQPGESTGLTCPECNGGIWETVTDGLPRYRCRVGHEFGPEAFEAEQAERVEAALWTALRAVEERAALHRRIAARHEKRGNASTAESYTERADHSVEQAVVLRELVRRFGGEHEEEGAA
jgi:two-component system, chemotaxis family, protein-glutamate methylesterase/glutaminase